MLILLLVGVFLAWYPQKILYRKYWKKGLSVRVEFQDSYIYEGDSSAMKEIVANDKILPLPILEVRLAMSRNLEFQKDARTNTSVTDQSYKRDIFSFLFRQQITRTLGFVGKKRGYYQITDANVVGYDFLLGSGYYADFPQQAGIYVYPRQVDTGRIHLICRAVSGMVLSRNRLYPDPFEFSGIREYRKEDPMNRINWKASARCGELMVNQFDATTNITVTVILDVEDRNILKYENLVEESISITSSLVGKLVAAKMDVRVVSNAVDDAAESAFSQRLPAGAGKTAELNQKLACLDIRREVSPIEEQIRAEAQHERSGHTYVLISKNKRREVQEALRALAGSDNQVLWVIPIDPADEQGDLQDRKITMMYWEVEP